MKKIRDVIIAGSLMVMSFAPLLTQAQMCAPGGEWRCYWVAEYYASGDCAHYQGSACLWCDCYAIDPGN